MRVQSPRTSLSLFILILSATSLSLSAQSAAAAPAFSCDPSNPSTSSLPFCNTRLPIADRVNDLVPRLTLDEKIQQLVNTAAAIPRLNISAYEWWSEALHGVSRHGRGVNFNGSIKSATMFPQIILSAASFDSRLWYRIAQVSEVRQQIGPQSGNLAIYCTDASIARYLRARNWNVKKAVKMLKATLKWRLEYKPEEIRWDDVAEEAETGKIYVSNYKDKIGRPVLIMRPRCQNSKSIKGQIKYLVYCMENAVLDLPPDQEQMIWMIDFNGFNLSHISIKITRETAHVLQEHYPERLGVAILYNAPKIFEPFWMVARPFLEAKTANKVKFVYADADDPNTNKIMNELFDMEMVESAFGGKDDTDFNITKYAERMREDDKRSLSFWKKEAFTATTPLPAPPNSETGEKKSDVQPKKCGEEDKSIPVDESVTLENYM